MKFLIALIISTLGGTILLHYLKVFILREKRGFVWDWDGILERGIITYCLVYHSILYLIPLIIFVKTFLRVGLILFLENWIKVNEPGMVYQKVRLKSELAFDLILSPLFSVLVGIIFS